MITGEEFARRMRWISQMRTLVLGLRRSARKAYEKGKIPYKPADDYRSDAGYWRKQALYKNDGGRDGEQAIRVIPRTVEVEDVAGFLKDKPRARKRLTLRQMDETMAKAIKERRQ